MNHRYFVPLLAAACALLSAPAHADDKNWFLRTGPAALILNEGATVRNGGAVIPGGTVQVDPHVTGTVEFGYFFTPELSVSFTGGYPPTVGINGAGSLKALGELGSITYGPTALTAQYHFNDFGRFKPYVGGGPMYMFVFDNEDGSVANVNVKPAIGVALQAGVDMAITEDWGLFVDVKKAFLRTTATGNLGEAPIQADVRLDPLVISAGVSLRF